MAIIRILGAFLLIPFLCFLLIAPNSTFAGDTITPSQPFRDGDNINSTDGTYQMGFFSMGISKNRYLGIWYRDIPDKTIVWVANRDKPITGPSNDGLLQLNNDGTLVLLDRINGSGIWSTTASPAAVIGNQAVVAQLLNSGNLVVKRQGDDNVDNSIWQSFDYMGDTFLPGMKLGRNLVTGLNRKMISWKSPEDPSPGNFTYGVEIGGYPEIVQRENSTERYRTGPWTGLSFSGTPHLKPNLLYTYEFVFNELEAYYIYYLRNSSVVSRMAITPAGLIQRYTWLGGKQGWMIYLTAQNDNCDRYGVCGAYASCDIESSPSCSCLEGFVPKVPKEWGMVDWTNGCVRRTELMCSGDGFLKHTGVKLPETRNKSWFNVTMSLDECRDACLRNCSCTAYANLDVRNGGTGCLIWFAELLDIRELYENGESLYIRMAASEIADESGSVSDEKNGKKLVWIIVGGVSAAGGLLVTLGMIIWVKRKKQLPKGTEYCSDCLHCLRSTHMSSDKEDLELPLFDLTTITSATNSFSPNNILGQGGFGTVYKGTLRDGIEIAVKRLSSDSKQGADEFKNEAINIAKLQHRNLVRLLGCCVQRGERMLLYEFMPNRSLDVFIFDKTQSRLLDWPKRYNIIKGIARGLLYLHQDSRLRIIHRDLKASNVLLDKDMNPKISDFGLAKTFVGNTIQGNTRNVVGTYGYMSPEYAIDGIYSIKSDVFSFGVMVLEVVSGERNRGFSRPDHQLNLLGHAWTLQREDRATELIDEQMREFYEQWQVLRLIHIGLLCVQKSPEDRPTMSAIMHMLDGEGDLVEPKQPGFFTERDLSEESSSSSGNNKGSCTNASMTITLLLAR
ncbi:G-type lectin S-receptor-like serine/threonine-protein kinase At4g27290 [Linum perenne]